MHRALPLVFVIGTFLSALTYAQAEEPEVDDDGASVHKGMVIVEPDVLATESADGEFKIRPYRERRPRWGVTVGADYCTYDPVNYEPHFLNAVFGDVYGAAQMPLIELIFGLKKNMSFGGLGFELGGGGYSNSSDPASGVNSTLTLYPIRAGVTLALDTLFSEPYVVPYVALGAYAMIFRESTPGASFNGNTQPAPYANLGLAILLNWIDPHSARVAFEDQGLQATYLTIELRKFFASSAGQDPDLSNEISYSAGIKVEF